MQDMFNWAQSLHSFFARGRQTLDGAALLNHDEEKVRFVLNNPNGFRLTAELAYADNPYA